MPEVRIELGRPPSLVEARVWLEHRVAPGPALLRGGEPQVQGDVRCEPLWLGVAAPGRSRPTHLFRGHLQREWGRASLIGKMVLAPSARLRLAALVVLALLALVSGPWPDRVDLARLIVGGTALAAAGFVYLASRIAARRDLARIRASLQRPDWLAASEAMRSGDTPRARSP